MSCGCGGECCKQKGLGLGFLAIEPQDTGGDFWGFDDSYWQSGGGDFWGFDNSYWSGGYGDTGSSGPSFTMGDPNFYNQFRQTNQGQSNSGSLWDWSGVLDWIQRIVGTPGGTVGPDGLPHCADDEQREGVLIDGVPTTICVPRPTGTNQAQQQAARNAAIQKAQAAQQAAKAAQQQSQGCPPNTGLVKNAQGQCVCPPGYAPNAQLKKCVLVNPALANSAANIPDWLKWLLIVGVVVLVVKR